MRFLKPDFDTGIVVCTFILTRIIAYTHFGIIFDAIPLPYYWQYIAVPLLQDDLLRSLYYLHDQPPLFNLFLGIVVKIFGDHNAMPFKVAYLILGLAIALSLLAGLKRLGVSRIIRVTLTCLFISSPVLIEYENWLLYEYPVCCLLLLSVLWLHKFLESRRARDCFWFFMILALVIYTRGMLTLYWFLLAGALLIVFHWQERKQILRAGALPLALILMLYLKNLAVFGTFSTSISQVGSNLAITITGTVPRIANMLRQQNLISGLYTIDQYQPLSDYAPYGIIPKQTGIPILDYPLKSGHWINAHHLAYLEIGEIDYRDALYVFRQYWPRILAIRIPITFKRYVYPADACAPYYFYNRQPNWQSLKSYYKQFVLGKLNDSRALLLIIGFPVLIAYACYLSGRGGMKRLKGRSATPQEVIAGYMLLTIAVLFVSSIFVSNDISRYRFMIDPFYIMLLGLLLSHMTSIIKANMVGREGFEPPTKAL